MRAIGRLKVFLFLPFLALAACGGDSLIPATILPPSPTVVSMNVVAAGDINPNSAGRASPVVLRIYRLSSPSIFNEADFFQLFEEESATLGADLLGREELVVMPSSSQVLTREVPDDTAYIGVIANFRDADRAIWRASLPIAANETTNFAVALQANAVVVAAQP